MLESELWSRSFKSEWKCSLHAIPIEAERAHSQELLSTVIRDLKTTQNLGNNWFFWYGLLNNKCFFSSYSRYPRWSGPAWPYPARRCPARPVPALTLYDGLLFSQFKRYELEFLTNFGYRFLNCHIKCWSKTIAWFRNVSVSCKARFLTLFHTFRRVTQEPQNVFKTCSGF